MQKTPDYSRQMSVLGAHEWSVPRLVELSKDFKVMNIPLAHINMRYNYRATLRELVGHIESAINANLDYPIILDEDGEIMDGRHRLMRCILEGKKSIKAVRFEVNPTPCSINDD